MGNKIYCLGPQQSQILRGYSCVFLLKLVHCNSEKDLRTEMRRIKSWPWVSTISHKSRREQMKWLRNFGLKTNVINDKLLRDLKKTFSVVICFHSNMTRWFINQNSFGRLNIILKQASLLTHWIIRRIISTFSCSFRGNKMADLLELSRFDPEKRKLYTLCVDLEIKRLAVSNYGVSRSLHFIRDLHECLAAIATTVGVDW
jgi:hypothetical protein